MFQRFIVFSFFICITSVQFQSVAHSRLTLDSCHSEVISHHDWNLLLNRYVQEGFVDYRAWHGVQKDKDLLQRYVAKLAGYCKPAYTTLTDAARFALVLNLYNASVIGLILNHYPLSSINDIDDGLVKVFDKPIMTLKWYGSQKVSLNALENTIIRPTFKDPRIHFALVCAAKSCPRLLNRAYMPGVIDKQLEAQTNKFFRDEAQISYSQNDKVIRVSKIFEWYRKDFEVSSGSLKAYLYHELAKVRKTTPSTEATVKFRAYSWKLNQSP